MHRFRNVLILAAVAVILVGLVSVVRRAPPDEPGETGLLLPALGARINDVAQVEVTRRGETFTVSRADRQWTVTDRDGYPAQIGTVRNTLLGIARMQRLEAKTSRPEMYPKLQVEDVTQPDAESVLYALRAEDGTDLAQVILGNERPTPGDPDRRQYYARLAGDPQSWLVQTDSEPNGNLLDWLQQPVLEIDESRIRRVVVEHPGNDPVTVERPQPDSTDFALAALPQGKKITYQFSINDVANSFARLRLDDVRRAGKIDFDDPIRAVMETFDGLRVTLESVAVDGQRYARLTAAVADSVADAGQRAETGESTESNEAATKDAADPAQEAATLNARWQDWAYRLDEAELGNIIKPLSELVEDIPAPQSDTTTE